MQGGWIQRVWGAGRKGSGDPTPRRTRSYRGSITSVASQKRSISFDESVLAEAKQRAAAKGSNLSAFVNAAVLQELRIARGLELLSEDDAQFGPVPGDVSSEIAATWPA